MNRFTHALLPFVIIGCGSSALTFEPSPETETQQEKVEAKQERVSPTPSVPSSASAMAPGVADGEDWLASSNEEPSGAFAMAPAAPAATGPSRCDAARVTRDQGKRPSMPASARRDRNYRAPSGPPRPDDYTPAPALAAVSELEQQ
jgi:hypothetical protein